MYATLELVVERSATESGNEPNDRRAKLVRLGGALRERDRADWATRQRSAPDRVSAADACIVDGHLRRPEAQERRSDAHETEPGPVAHCAQAEDAAT